MGSRSDELFKDFRDDHIVLGRGFGKISECLRAGDLERAEEAARAVDRDAGAHIAFEEKVFYPKLIDLLGEEEVARLYDEHKIGLAVIMTLTSMRPNERPGRQTIEVLLADSETMEQHIAECGELFHALARLPEVERVELLRHLRHWRAMGPSWHELQSTEQRIFQRNSPE
jgi:hypothetical protein